MKLAIGSDEQTSATTRAIDHLRAQGHELTLFGALSDPANPSATLWPEVARCVAEQVSEGHVQEGILFCWTGTGVSIAANKVPGIRAALCEDSETAVGARRWNNANVLCLSLRRLSEARTIEVLEAWFGTHYEPNAQDDACLRQIEMLEQRYGKRYTQSTPSQTQNGR